MRALALPSLLPACFSFAACTAPQSGAGEGDDTATNGHACPATPIAWVLAPADEEAAMSRLREAGFDARRLPLDRSPFGLSGLIVLGSFAADDPTYVEYMSRWSADLYSFVDDANVLLQLAQNAEAEPEPPFLPSTHRARRSDVAVDDVAVVSESSLLAGVEPFEGAIAAGASSIADPFVEQSGFQVVLADQADGVAPLLMEGAYGQGRIVLSALDLDLPSDAAEIEAVADAFFANTREHVSGVCERDTDQIAVTPDPEPTPFTPGSVTFAVLPDTQVYALRIPGLFDLQTSWLAHEANDLGLAYVFHLGDIVNNNTPLEWERARNSMRPLDGVVSYAMVPGNHDYGPSGDASTRDTLLNDYFDFAEHSAQPGFGGAFVQGRLDNTYHLFSAGGHDWIVIALEWGPRDEVIAWANGIMSAHPDRLGILVTHAYLNNNDRRYDHTDTEHPQSFNPHEYDTPGVNDGEELWQELVRHHRFVMTINGHVLGDGTGFLTSETDTGTQCHQMLVNYQMRDLGGEAYMRLLELLPDGRTVVARSYSPLHDRYMLAPDQQFTFTLDVD